MKKIRALILSVATLCTLASCSYRVKNEGKAEKVYTCPADNMFGIEKAVIFEDGITLVFDKKASDKSEHEDFKDAPRSKELYGLPVELHDTHHKKPHVRSSFVEKSGKYVASATFYGDEDTSDVVINGMTLFGKVVDVNDGNITLSYEDWETATDGHLVIKQQFDASTGQWGEVETEFFSTWSEG